MRGRKPLKAAGLVVSSALLILAVTLVGLFAFIYYNTSAGLGWSAPMEDLSNTLTQTEGGYRFTGEALLGEDRWAMLLDGEGRVVWSLRRPADVPEAYSLTDVAAFTRWYLRDYPVQCWVRGDGLLVVGSPKGSVWKHDIALHMETMLQLPLWFAGFFLLALICVLGLAALVLRRWFRREQQARDAARSGWINGISHDIRTPLSVVMGYAAQMAADPGLPAERRRQAAILCRQSQAIRDLVNDLNLTMRLDCEMQVLRRECLQPAAFLRQTVADFLNSGLAEGFPLEVELPEASLPALEVDAFLLRRAVNNLLSNCVRHNPPGCPIRVGARAQGDQVILWVESAAAAGLPGQAAPEPPLEADGGAAHGTGLKLVAQIAAAHGGEARFSGGTTFRCELWLPAGQRIMMAWPPLLRGKCHSCGKRQRCKRKRTAAQRGARKKSKRRF